MVRTESSMSPHHRSPIEATKQKAHFITQANTAVYQICMNPTNCTRTTLREIVAERSTRTLVGPQGMSIGKLPVKRGVALD